MVSEHLASHDDTPRVSYAEAVIADLRQRFFDGCDSEILVMQQPMRRLQHMAELASVERYQRRLERLFAVVDQPGVNET